MGGGCALEQLNFCRADDESMKWNCHSFHSSSADVQIAARFVPPVE